MIDILVDILKSYDSIEYKIIENIIKSYEAFFVKKQMEVSRNIDVQEYVLTIYKDFEEDGIKYKGSAECSIHPTFSNYEIKKEVENLIYCAQFVKNEYFELIKENKNDRLQIERQFEEDDISKKFCKIIESFYKNDNLKNAYVSYSEFFIKQIDKRIVNSKGLDLFERNYSLEFESAVTWNSINEVEVYESAKFSNFDQKILQDTLEHMFLIAQQKSKAIKTPSVKNLDILLTGECLKIFFSYYYENSNAQNIYNNISMFKVNENIQGQDILGDKISMTLKPIMENSTFSRSFDNDGLVLKEHKIIQDGVLLKYWADQKYSSYLGIETTGNIQNFEISGGTYSIDDLKQDNYLELVSFSDFQMDEVTGNFASEIRLGFLHLNKKIVPVCGGSISGNINDVQKNLKMSTKQKQYNNFIGPETICFKNVNIVGA